MTLTQHQRPTPTGSGPSQPTPTTPSPSWIEQLGPNEHRFEEILTPEALDFLAALHDRFASRRSQLLTARAMRRESISGGAMFDFLPETAAIRDDPTWRVAGAGPGLEDRRVEITGPTDRRMTVNAMNSGRERVARGRRGRPEPHLAQRHHRAAEPARCDPSADRLRHR